MKLLKTQEVDGDITVTIREKVWREREVPFSRIEQRIGVLQKQKQKLETELDDVTIELEQLKELSAKVSG